MDMDPMLVRATRLLLSTSKDSADQLRAMLEDAIRQRYGDTKSLAHLTITKEYVPKKEASSKHSSSSSARKEERDMEKKRHERQSVVELPEPLKPADTIRSKNVPAQRDSEPTRDVVMKEVDVDDDLDEDDDDDIYDDIIDNDDNEVEDDDDDDDDDDDLALEILEDDLSCVVCRGMSVGVCNQLVECLDCHSLYHQECHQPPVAKADINDPRWAWYCAACTKAINKQPSKSSSSTSSKSVTSTVPHSSSHVSSKTSLKGQTDVGQNLFKRQDSTSKSSSSSSKSHISPASSMGMAGLAASFQPSGTTSQSVGKSSSSSSSSSAKVVAPPKVVTNVISADKRLANMKKKAAAKQQEKRKHIK